MPPNTESEQVSFCQRMSRRMQRLLDEWGDDPRSVYGADAIHMLKTNGVAVNALDAREGVNAGETFDTESAGT